MKLLRFVRGINIPKDRYDPEIDGVSPTLLSKWKACRERARLTMLGWKRRKQGAAQIFGTIAHGVLEIIYSKIQSGEITNIPTTKQVHAAVARVEKKWRTDNSRADSETISTMEMMLLLVEQVMPIYFTFWNRDLTRMEWFHLEQFVGSSANNRPFGKYETHLRGKLDGAFVPQKTKRKWLFETKTKSRLGEQGEGALIDIMPLEAQTHIYLGALQDMTKGEVPGGVLLNIIRRPNLKLKKKEKLPAFAARVTADIKKRPQHYFIRIRMEINGKDLAVQRKAIDAQVTDFLSWYHGDSPHYHNSDACENKHGTCDFLRICSAKDYTGFYQSHARRGAKK